MRHASSIKLTQFVVKHNSVFKRMCS